MARYRQSERWARFRKRRDNGFPVVASEGDSWFSYEFFPNIIDLIEDSDTFAHLRFEMSGDTVENMVGTPLDRSQLLESIRAEKALFLLFSGGGNDIQQAADGLFQGGVSAADCIVDEKADELFDGLRRNYEGLIEDIGPRLPIVAHGYDYFRPSAEGVRIVGLNTGIGPWIHPEMVKAEIEDPDLQADIAEILVDRFNTDLEQLAADHPDNFIHVDLRGTLDPAEDWENEIHPTREGFEKVADAISKVIHSDVRTLLIKRSNSE